MKLEILVFLSDAEAMSCKLWASLTWMLSLHRLKTIYKVFETQPFVTFDRPSSKTVIVVIWIRNAPLEDSGTELVVLLGEIMKPLGAFLKEIWEQDSRDHSGILFPATCVTLLVRGWRYELPVSCFCYHTCLLLTCFPTWQNSSHWSHKPK